VTFGGENNPWADLNCGHKLLNFLLLVLIRWHLFARRVVVE
jgi:hypothetical protein